jgi:AraC family ethanolamine operon transcriptional activator
MKLKATRHSLRFEGFDPAQLEELLSDSHIEHFLLGPGTCNVRHQRWICPGLSLDVGCYSFPVRVVGAFPEKKICVGYMRSQNTSTWMNGIEIGPHSIEYYPAGTELNFRTGANGEWVAIEFEEEALQMASIGRLGHELELPRDGTVSLTLPRAEYAALDRQVRKLMAQSEVEAGRIGEFLGFLGALLDHLRKKEVASLLRRSRKRSELIARADTYLQNHLDQPFDVRRLASEVGTTERSLQRHFADAYGVTPHEWARCLALHRVRERLKTADARLLTIEGIARDFGFQHMGRFAEYYRRLFDEFPSVTLTKDNRAIDGLA